MSKKRVNKMLATIGSVICLSISILESPITSITVSAADDATIQPYKDDIQWRFKVENNKLYKRLYNYSTISWVGDWIYVRDLP